MMNWEECARQINAPATLTHHKAPAIYCLRRYVGDRAGLDVVYLGARGSVVG
jgi:hypothetical protein